jgi:uncharacterized RDD family membrane protein YckC
MSPAPPPSITRCLECDAPLSPAESQGLCARCLLKLGLASQFGENSVAEAGGRKLVPPPMFPFDFGGYHVQRLLGRGGMGAVSVAEEIGTGRRVALKVLGHTLDSEEVRKRFLREGRLAASLNHPNSVYIFGTEEIDGAPVITMELVAGGTLRDRMRKGPLPVKEAVDAILGVIAGLEAAAAAGVLHRDVKPANCFVAPDGTVKIGDFGLSVSTLARDDSQLTASGVMLGTPSFAPPEQLRGDELDVRADIYSVGATLYSLLTGRPPHEGDNAVQVVASVLDKTPKPIGEFRQDVPPGLVEVIGRCLVKKRGDRYADYAALREALLPFSGSVPEPAPLGLRFIAGIIDCLLAFLPNTILTVYFAHDLSTRWAETRAAGDALNFFGTLAFVIAYFTLGEARWGATPAKALCGFRVMGPDGGPPSYGRALLRTLLFLAIFESGALLQALLGHAAPAITSQRFGFGFDELGTLIFVLSFCTMRRRNGFAALHEIATGTRTVVREKRSPRPQLEVAPLAASSPNESPERVGPYRLVSRRADAGWAEGFDDILRRHVWIRFSPPGMPPVDEARREVSRATRLRWIGGLRTESANWDAYEAPLSAPLLGVSPRPWRAVRYWLADLAGELHAGAKDGTLPGTIALANVSITADGRAVLLDEPRALEEGARTFTCATPAGAQEFLHAVAENAVVRTGLPLHAQAFLQTLAAGAFEQLSHVVGNLQSLLAKPAEVSRRRRFAALALLPAGALFTAAVMSLMVGGMSAGTAAKPSGADEAVWDGLKKVLPIYATIRTGPPNVFMNREAAEAMRDPAFVARTERYISGHYAWLIRRDSFDADATAAGLTEQDRELARAAVAAQPAVTPEQLKQEDAVFGPALQVVERSTKARFIGPIIAITLLLAIGSGSLMAGVISGVSPILHLLGLAVVDRRGRRAGRLRLLARSALVWGPLLFTLPAIYLNLPMGLLYGAILFSAGAFLVGIPWTVIRPAAGPHDLLAGTRVVPR